MSELESIARKHGTDKAAHGYCPHYERFIGEFQSSSCVLLEMGVDTGDSLRMWRDWLPKAMIFGLDTKSYQPDFPFKVFKGNQGNIDDLWRMTDVVPHFNIVIDDAGHNVAEQKIAFDYLWSRVVPGGWYVVEDLDQGLSCLELVDVASVLIGIARAEGSVQEIHAMSKGRGDGILFLKKR